MSCHIQSYSSVPILSHLAPKYLPDLPVGFFFSHFQNMVFPDILSKLWRMECVCLITTDPMS